MIPFLYLFSISLAVVGFGIHDWHLLGLATILNAIVGIINYHFKP